MWWGGFSENIKDLNYERLYCLNPHVVGRFFRAESDTTLDVSDFVLIPMWWGGFSEQDGVSVKIQCYSVLIPMWWGGFSET